MALDYIERIDLGLRTDKFRELSEYVAAASGRVLPTWKPIVGANLFVYESENRASAALRDPTTYEVFPPEAVGLTRGFILGKHSGVDTLRMKLDEHDIHLADGELALLTCRIRSRSIMLKRALFDEELLDIYRAEIDDVRDEVRQAVAEGQDVHVKAAEHALAAMAQVSADLTVAEEAVGSTTSCCTSAAATDAGKGVRAAAGAGQLRAPRGRDEVR